MASLDEGNILVVLQGEGFVFLGVLRYFSVFEGKSSANPMLMFCWGICSARLSMRVGFVR